MIPYSSDTSSGRFPWEWFTVVVVFAISVTLQIAAQANNKDWEFSPNVTSNEKAWAESLKRSAQAAPPRPNTNSAGRT